MFSVGRFYVTFKILNDPIQFLSLIDQQGKIGKVRGCAYNLPRCFWRISLELVRILKQFIDKKSTLAHAAHNSLEGWPLCLVESFGPNGASVGQVRRVPSSACCIRCMNTVEYPCVRLYASPSQTWQVLQGKWFATKLAQIRLGTAFGTNEKII